MRESLGHNIVPFKQDNLSGMLDNVMAPNTLVSSNGYYGYQAPLLHTEKACDNNNYNNNNNNNNNNDERVPNVNCGVDMMEVQYTPERPITVARACRKRAYEGAKEYNEFKKRRHTGPNEEALQPSNAVQIERTSLSYSNMHLLDNKKLCAAEVKNQDSTAATNHQLLYEELLRETHGTSYYHWISSAV